MSVKISLKTCKFKDAKFLMDVYNSAVEGGFYNSTKMVVLKDHNKWLKSKLKSKSSKIYIGYKNKKKFRYVRCDKVKNNIRSQRCFLRNNFKLVKFNKKKHVGINKINTKKENYYEYKTII